MPCHLSKHILPLYRPGYTLSLHIVHRASVDQQKRLVLYYLSKLPRAAHSVLWQPAILQVLNALLREARLSPEESQTREWNLYFGAWMLGLSKQLPFYSVTDKIIKGILAMAVRDGVMNAFDAQKTLESMRRKTGTDGWEDFHELVASDNRDVPFIVNLDLATKNAAAATAEALVNEFDKLSMLANVAPMVVRGQVEE